MCDVVGKPLGMAWPTKSGEQVIAFADEQGAAGIWWGCTGCGTKSALLGDKDTLRRGAQTHADTCTAIQI
jgi:hypothetical protein